MNKKRTREEAFPMGHIQSKFMCPCSQIIILDEDGDDVELLGEHRRSCEVMGKQYGALFDSWEHAVLDGSIDNWRNIRALYEAFRARFFQYAEQAKMGNKRRKIIEDVAMIVLGKDEEVKIE